MKIKGRWHIQHVRDGKIIAEWEQENIVTNEGMTHLLDVCLGGGTQISAWFVGLTGSSRTPLVADNYATPGFSEVTAYTGNRPAWTCGDVTTNSISNTASKAEFTFTGADDVYGAALFSYATKADTAQEGAVLFDEVLFTAPRSVIKDDILRVTVTVDLANAA